MSSPTPEDPLYDAEGNDNSVDAFEKQLQQQERELLEQLRLQEEEEQAKKEAAVSAAAMTNDTDADTAGDATDVLMADDNSSVPTAVAPPTVTMPPAWQQDNNTVSEDMAVDDSTEDTDNNSTTTTTSIVTGIKRPSSASPAMQENGEGDGEAATGNDDKQPQVKQRKVDEFAKLWAAVTENPKDFQAWTMLLQHVDQQNELESGRDAYGAFFARYPYCYGYWKKFADLEKRKGTKESTLKVFERGIAAIPLSVDLWVHYMDYIITTYKEKDEEQFVRDQFERALAASGLEFRSDKIWDAFINWENTGKHFQNVTAIYDRLLATPVAKYLQHWTRFQDHVKRHTSGEVISVEEFLTFRRSLTTDDAETTEEKSTEDEAPPGVEEDMAAGEGVTAASAAAATTAANDEENKNIQQLIISAREKIHQATADEVKLRWSYEDSIKRPYFHVKPLERSQLQAWRDYLEFEIKQGIENRTRTLFERCLIAAALYEEFWMRYLHYLDTLSGVTAEEIRSVYERACNIHLKDKIKPHLSWANFEEEKGNVPRALELLSEIQKRLPEALEPHLQAVAVERRRGNLTEADELFNDSIIVVKEEKLSSAYVNMIVRYGRFLSLFMGKTEKAVEFIQTTIADNTPTKPTDKDQKCLEILLWALIDRAMACDPPLFSVAAEALTSGTTEKFPPRTRLLFANRFNQFVAECGPPGTSVSASTKLLRDLQQELRQLEAAQDDNMDCSTDKQDDQHDQAGSESRRDKRDKSHAGSDISNKSYQPPPSNYQHQNGGGNMGAGGGQNYNNVGGGGGYQNQGHQQQQQNYPPQNAGNGPPNAPPQHPPPQGQSGYGGYNQNYQQGYPPQQYQGGWGYPQQQQQGYGGYNQQNWAGYPNYYGQR